MHMKKFGIIEQVEELVLLTENSDLFRERERRAREVVEKKIGY